MLTDNRDQFPQIVLPLRQRYARRAAQGRRAARATAVELGGADGSGTATKTCAVAGLITSI